MSEDDGTPKEHEASQRKLDRERGEGNVAKSPDASSSVLLIIAGCTLILTADHFLGRAAGVMERGLVRAIEVTAMDPGQALELLDGAHRDFLGLMAPLLAVVFAGALLVSIAQVGVRVSPKALAFKGNRLDPVKGYKNRVFSSEALVNLGLTLLKFVVIGGVAIWVFRSSFQDIIGAVALQLPDIPRLISTLMGNMVAKLSLLILGIGGIDLAYRRYKHREKLKMSEKELRDELKEDEGDPDVKRARQTRHRELLSQAKMRQDIPDCAVTVVNPTHVAVSLKYEEGGEYAPRVMAKGRGEMAQEIIRISRKHGVPVRRDPVVHALAQVKIGRQIPDDLYHAVAVILRWALDEAATKDP